MQVTGVGPSMILGEKQTQSFAKCLDSGNFEVSHVFMQADSFAQGTKLGLKWPEVIRLWRWSKQFMPCVNYRHVVWG